MVYDIGILETERMKKFLTYKDVADRAGVDNSSVFRLLSGEKKIRRFRNPELIKKIAIVLEVDPEELVKAA
jgi:transcriptional regulator with XRE-family HTH domain